MKKSLLFSCIILLCAGFFVPVYGQNAKLEGTWTIENIDIQQIEENGSPIKISTIEKDEYFTFGIFDQMSFKKNQCYFLLEGKELSTQYEIKDNSFQINIGSMSFLYNFSFNNEKKMILHRNYTSISQSKQINYLITLTYANKL